MKAIKILIAMFLAGLLFLVKGRTKDESIKKNVDNVSAMSPIDKVKLGNKLARKGKRRTKRKPSDLFF